MVASGGGAIVNVSSISAIRPRGMTPYTVSKGAIVPLTQAMAIDPRPRRHPRKLHPARAQPTRPWWPAECRRRCGTFAASASPLQIEGNSWDIAYAALYLASDEARWVTGVALPVDGGVTLDSPRR